MNESALRNGQFHFNIEMEDGTLVPHCIDVLELKLTCEECEDRHSPLPTYDDGTPRASRDFLRELSQKLVESGVAGCTPAVAYQLWHVAGKKLAELKKNTVEQPSLPSDST